MVNRRYLAVQTLHLLGFDSSADLLWMLGGCCRVGRALCCPQTQKGSYPAADARGHKDLLRMQGLEQGGRRCGSPSPANCVSRVVHRSRTRGARCEAHSSPWEASTPWPCAQGPAAGTGSGPVLCRTEGSCTGGQQAKCCSCRGHCSWPQALWSQASSGCPGCCAHSRDWPDWPGSWAPVSREAGACSAASRRSSSQGCTVQRNQHQPCCWKCCCAAPDAVCEHGGHEAISGQAPAFIGWPWHQQPAG